LSASKYYLLKNTLSDIEKKSEEIIAIDKQIPKKQVDLNIIEAKLRDASNEHQNKKKKLEKFENDSLEHVNADIKSLKSSLRDANKLEKNYSRTNCSGLSSKEFKAEKLDDELRVTENSWDLDEDDRTSYQVWAIIILAVIGSVLVFGLNVFDDPKFECTDGDGSVDMIWVFDGEEDCSDGSDEAESSSGEEQTEAEIFYDDSVLVRYLIVSCCGPVILGALFPYLMSIIKGTKNIKIVWTNEKIHAELNAKYGEQIAKLARLETDRRAIEHDLRRLEIKINSHNHDKHNLKEIANRIKKLEANIEIEQSELDNMVKTKSSLEEQIDSDWDKISDMIPYSNLVSSKNKSSAKDNDLDF
jgi:hypothetical protein